MTIEKTNNLSIRDAYDNEHDAIQDITLAAYEEYAEIMLPPIWARYRQLLLATLNEEGPVERIVAVLDNVIAGSVLLYPPDGSTYPGMMNSVGWPEVRSLAVPPSMRGQGVGTALMEECERRARRSGATVLGLHTMDMMQTAMRMYERMGFVRVPELDFRPTSNLLIKGYHRRLDPDVP